MQRSNLKFLQLSVVRLPSHPTHRRSLLPIFAFAKQLSGNSNNDTHHLEESLSKHNNGQKPQLGRDAAWKVPWVGIAVIFIAAGGSFTYVSSRHRRPALHPSTFQPYTLVAKERVSTSNSILTVRSPTRGTSFDAEDPYAQYWSDGVWSVEIKQPQLQIARSYTPLPPLLRPRNVETNSAETSDSDQGYRQGDIRMLIRREDTGEVSNYLHKLPIGAKVDVRGGHAEFVLPEDVAEVLFLAGGTGVAPALQIAHTLAQRSKLAAIKEAGKETAMCLLWANRHREECMGATVQADRNVKTNNGTAARGGLLTPEAADNYNPLVQQLDGLHTPEVGFQLNTKYFVDEERTFINPEEIRNALATFARPHGTRPTSGRKLILLSGPDGFVEYFAGPKKIGNGMETNGLTGGILSQINLQGWSVWKL